MSNVKAEMQDPPPPVPRANTFVLPYEGDGYDAGTTSMLYQLREGSQAGSHIWHHVSGHVPRLPYILQLRHGGDHAVDRKLDGVQQQQQGADRRVARGGQVERRNPDHGFGHQVHVGLPEGERLHIRCLRHGALREHGDCVAEEGHHQVLDPAGAGEAGHHLRLRQGCVYLPSARVRRSRPQVRQGRGSHADFGPVPLGVREWDRSHL